MQFTFVVMRIIDSALVQGLSQSLNTWDEFFNHVGLRLNVKGYDVVTIFRSSGLFLVT